MSAFLPLKQDPREAARRGGGHVPLVGDRHVGPERETGPGSPALVILTSCC